MDPFAYNPAEGRGQQQKKPTSVFKAMLPRSHKNNRSPDAVASPTKSENIRPAYAPVSPTKSGNIRSTVQEPRKDLPMLPVGIPNSNLPLTEAAHNRDRNRFSPRKSVDVYDDTKKKPAGVEDNAVTLGKDKKKVQKQQSSAKEEEVKPKKSKSSTTLSAMFGKSKSSRSLKSNGEKQQHFEVKDKENCTPPNSSNGPPPPIWAQFASPPIMEVTSTQKVPLNDRWDVNHEMERYTPQEYSPSKGRNFHEEQPTLYRRAEPKPRPKSAYLPTSLSSNSITETISVLRKVSQRHKRTEVGRFQEQIGTDGTSSRRSSTDSRKFSNDSSNSGLTMAKRGSRVQAAVAALNGKAKEPEVEARTQVPSDPRAFDKAFEAVLESRNIEPNVREKMRALDTNIKAEFIKKNNLGSASSQNSLDPGSATYSRPTSSRPNTGVIAQFDGEWPSRREDEKKPVPPPESPKKLRPRSLTFTLSKGDHASKKERADRPASHSRTKSASIVQSASSSSLNAGVSSFASVLLNKAPKQAVPEDFITYFRKVQNPQLVEVGRLQKLRQLLRNETVTWVDSFIALGGVTEIVGLLYRIIDIEWREEHEDTLLHHTLTCLKALFTTSLALTYLSSLHSTLFPTLLRLLFSSGDDKKGPSEFSTRGIVISLLFTYLSTSPPASLPSRARTLLSYLRDPGPKEEEAPPGFIAEMSRPRPYKIWQKEISNVTKEVFWIFLHHVNVVPHPAETEDPALSFTTRHFPTPRPPVPAAPYVGGVEWESTTYLATHLDLMNGLLAALPMREERNALRMQLRDSGFERVMGETLRTCKEKFYGGVHAGLGTWVGAAAEDGWDTGFVREGPRREDVRLKVRGGGARESPKKKVEVAPRLEVPWLDLGGEGEGGWLGRTLKPDTASYGQAGDMLLYENDMGKAPLLERDDLRERISTLESKIQKLEATTEACQVRTCQIQHDVKRLAAASDGYLKIRARFLDMLSTGTTTKDGKAAAHDGDAATDAFLYTSRKRTDLPLLHHLYGIPYDWIIRLSEADNFDALAAVNCRGTLRANREIGLPKEVEEAYQLYIMVQMENAKQSPQEDPLKPLGRAYHKFWEEYRQHSLKYEAQPGSCSDPRNSTGGLLLLHEGRNL